MRISSGTVWGGWSDLDYFWNSVACGEGDVHFSKSVAEWEEDFFWDSVVGMKISIFRTEKCLTYCDIFSLFEALCYCRIAHLQLEYGPHLNYQKRICTSSYIFFISLCPK